MLLRSFFNVAAFSKFTSKLELSFPPSHQFLTASANITRSFHHTPLALAKKKKGGDSAADDEAAPAPPDVKEVEAEMQKRIAYLKEEFARLHNSRVSKDMFNNVLVDAYGSKSPIPECGQVSVQSASKVVINVFDSAIVSAVASALRDCGLNLNPIVEGSVVSVPIPKASKEKREDVVKLAKKAAEKTKQEIRHIRKTALDKLKELKSAISEDDTHKCTKEVDAATEKKIKAVDAELKVKEKDILS